MKISLIATPAVLALLLSACTVEVPEGSSSPTPSPSGGSTVQEDGEQCVRTRDIESSETWSPALCPTGYTIKNDIGIRGTGTELKLEPGTVVKHEQAAGLTVHGGASLIAKGTAEKPISFEGWQAVPGRWRGLVFVSNSAKNELSHVKVAHAGSNKDIDGAIHVGLPYEEQGSLALSDVEVKDNSQYGLYLRRDAKLRSFTNTKIENNAKGVAHVEAPSVAQLRGIGSGNNWIGNGDDIVVIETNILVELTEDTTWPDMSPAKYRVVGQNNEGGDLVRVKQKLTIEAGAKFEMAGSSGFLVEGGTSGLKAVGTADKKIVFEGIGGSAWTGITFGESTWAENRLEHVEIKNASKAPEWQYYGSNDNSYQLASILMGYNGATPVTLTVKDVTFAGPNNAPADLFKKNACVLALEGTNVGAAGGALEVETTPY
jgi:hypothetical protein